MADTPNRTVSILFQTPKGDDSSYHERIVEDMPHSVAEQVAEDYPTARDPDSEVSPYQLYRYQRGGEEHLVALDYTEVVGVFV